MSSALRALVVLALTAASPSWSATLQDFDVVGSGTSFCDGNHVSGGSPSARLPGGPTGSGQFLRLAFADPQTIPSQTSIAFDRSDAGSPGLIVADFDFRLTPGSGQADGLGFALLDTATHGTSRVEIEPCGANTPQEDDCLGEAEPRAWSSPIFVNHAGS